MKNAKKVSVSGILTALTVILLLLGSLFQTLDLATAAMGSLVVMVAMIEIGNGWALGIYCASSLLGFLLVPNKVPIIVFSCFLGYYPVLKVFLHKFKPKAVSFFARLCVFNVFLFALLFAAKEMIFAESEVKRFWYLLVIMANVTFVVFDFALERVSVFYCLKLRGKIFKNSI